MTPRKRPEDRLKVGRPSEMTPEVLAKLDHAFSIGCADLEACLYADISKDTLYRYQAKHPEFCDRKELLKEKPVLKARNTVINNLGEDETARWYLERKKKLEFSLRNEVTGANGGPVTIADFIKQHAD